MAVERKLWAIFLSWVHLWKKQTPGNRRCHSVLGIPIPLSLAFWGMPKTLIASTLPKLFQTGEKSGLSITNSRLKSVRRYNSNMHLHYSAVNSWLTIPTFPQSEIIFAKLKRSAFCASPTGDAQNARSVGMGMPKTRGCPYHSDSAIFFSKPGLGVKKESW